MEEVRERAKRSLRPNRPWKSLEIGILMGPWAFVLQLAEVHAIGNIWCRLPVIKC
jgi:hypothetical protein